MNLGSMHEQGLGVEKSLKKASENYQKACNKGFSKACSKLAHIYEQIEEQKLE